MKKTFTLIEILVVATIIALLAGGGVTVYTQLNKNARNSKRKADIEQIRSALEMYRSDNNYYYSGVGSFNNNCSSVNWLTQYINEIPTDPKSNYYYRCNISANDYTIGVYLEETTSTCSIGSCGDTNCNYCLGPYGKK